jgi:hypothetical protein
LLSGLVSFSLRLVGVGRSSSFLRAFVALFAIRKRIAVRYLPGNGFGVGGTGLCVPRFGIGLGFGGLGMFFLYSLISSATAGYRVRVIAIPA